MTNTIPLNDILREIKNKKPYMQMDYYKQLRATNPYYVIFFEKLVNYLHSNESKLIKIMEMYNPTLLKSMLTKAIDGKTISEISNKMTMDNRNKSDETPSESDAFKYTVNERNAFISNFLKAYETQYRT